MARSWQAWHNFYVAQPYREFVEDHERLVADLATGKADHARRAMIDHIRRGFQRTPSGGPAGA